MKYALPCSCGRTNTIDSGQAGQTIVCSCGNQLEAPTMRGLSQLAKVEEAGADAPKSRRDATWSPRDEGLIFLGSVMLLVAISAGTYLYVTRPVMPQFHATSEQLEGMTAPEALEWWDMMEKFGVALPPSPEEAAAEREIAARNRWLYVTAAIGVVGAMLAIAGLALKPSRRRA